MVPGRVIPGLIAVFATAAGALGQRVVSRADYADRLHAMWLGQCIANWTGLRTEGARIAPPFFTDADWGTTPPGGQHINFVLDQDPWLADDDTDVEYVYLHKLAGLVPTRGRLSADEIRDAWLAHMDPAWIWVSNRRAWDLMGRGIRPPMTAHPVPNDLWGMIDAQLTTEFFGALSPGMPEQALVNADLPIRTTAFGYAIHASQFYAVLYALATQVDPGLSGRDKAVWLVREARKWIPSSSKSADIVDFVLADFLANPDVNNWELTRDRIADRYMINAAAHGFMYFNWPESSVNFACGVMCLLYGQCDYRRTVQIGTLSGWDSDNCTATMGGLLGLMLGYDALAAQFPGQPFSDRYAIDRTRNNLPDYLPGDPAAEDTFTLMAARMMPVIDGNVRAAGGLLDVQQNRWVLPGAVISKQIARNPGQQTWWRSANCRVPLLGGTVTCTSTAPPGTNAPTGVWNPWYFGNGYEHDFTGRDLQDWRRWAYSTEGAAAPPGVPITLQVVYDRPVEVWAVRFIEGDHIATGGWFQSVSIQVQVGGVWQGVSTVPDQQLDPAKPFQVIDFALPAPLQATGIRITGPAGAAAGGGGFITCCELDALARPAVLAADRARY